MKANMHILSTPKQVGETAANFVADLSTQAIAQRRCFTVAFSGGSLPKLLCPPLIIEPLRSQVNWSGWHVFWADERCVSLSDPESNYRLVRAYLFQVMAGESLRIGAVKSKGRHGWICFTIPENGP